MVYDTKDCYFKTERIKSQLQLKKLFYWHDFHFFNGSKITSLHLKNRLYDFAYTVITRKLWNRKTTFKPKLELKLVQWTLDIAIVQCKKTHFTYIVLCRNIKTLKYCYNVVFLFYCFLVITVHSVSLIMLSVWTFSIYTLYI